MDWKNSIKNLTGVKVKTYKGDKGVIRSFDVRCHSLGHFVGKYQVSFDHSGCVGWFSRKQLTFTG